MANSLPDYIHPSVAARNGLKPSERLLTLTEADALRRNSRCFCGGNFLIEADTSDELRTGDLACLSCGRSVATVSLVTPARDWAQVGRRGAPRLGRPPKIVDEVACAAVCGIYLTQRQQSQRQVYCSYACSNGARRLT